MEFQNAGRVRELFRAAPTSQVFVLLTKSAEKGTKRDKEERDEPKGSETILKVQLPSAP
jgi:hypothetical protein